MTTPAPKADDHDEHLHVGTPKTSAAPKKVGGG